MTDDTGAPENQKLEAERIEGFGLSEDGTRALMRFGTSDDGGEIRVTMPVANVLEFYTNLGKLVGSLRASGKVPPAAPDGRTLRNWKVGRSNTPQLAKLTALLFDEGTPQETMYVVDDLSALKIADALEQNVFKGLARDKQRELLSRAGLRPKIILPGVH